ncbi:MAG: NAD(P)H-hydrate dehydratase [Desulfobacteraceae bacterium]|nr:MAG: NAD(P)H-hydrate dehydratase [Desulfobacteraceae bacterium]
MHLVTAEEMREMDRQTIETFGLPGRVLMENAGRGAVRVLMAHFPDISGKKVGVIAGRGNNGGDGFVIARHLAQAGIHVTVYLLSDSNRLGGDAADNFRLLAPLDIPVREIPDDIALNEFKPEMAVQDIWVDAIFGTGLNADITGVFKSAIDFLNALDRPVLAVDIPSGLNADSGHICGVCLSAVATATFAFPKIGHVQSPGASYTGNLHIIDIGIPPHIVDTVDPLQHLLTKAAAAKIMIPRSVDAHKGQTGHVLVVAGSKGKTGAAALSGLAALRSGAGLVTLGIPKSSLPVVAALGMEVMTAPLAETDTGALSDDAWADVMSLLKDKKCLAIGPGMGTGLQTRRLVSRLIMESPVPVVVDADGLNTIADNPEILRGCCSEIVLTPHPGEMARLMGQPASHIQQNRIPCAREFAVKYNVHVVLKGARTLIAHPDGHVIVNLTGNPGMASAGMGDVLTGVVAGFIAQGYPPGTAAQLAVYLHGLAGDNLAAAKGPFGFIASDVMAALPEAIAGLMASGNIKRYSGSVEPVLEK